MTSLNLFVSHTKYIQTKALSVTNAMVMLLKWIQLKELLRLIWDGVLSATERKMHQPSVSHVTTDDKKEMKEKEKEK
jgi:hypothetical protein